MNLMPFVFVVCQSLRDWLFCGFYKEGNERDLTLSQGRVDTQKPQIGPETYIIFLSEALAFAIGWDDVCAFPTQTHIFLVVHNLRAKSVHFESFQEDMDDFKSWVCTTMSYYAL